MWFEPIVSEYGIVGIALVVALVAMYAIHRVVSSESEQISLQERLVQLADRGYTEAEQSREAFKQNADAIDRLSNTLNTFSERLSSALGAFKVGVEKQLFEQATALETLQKEISEQKKIDLPTAIKLIDAETSVEIQFKIESLEDGCLTIRLETVQEKTAHE